MSPGAQLIENEATVNFRNLLECADYEVGAVPFTLTAFHDGVDWIEVGSKPQKKGPNDWAAKLLKMRRICCF